MSNHGHSPTTYFRAIATSITEEVTLEEAKEIIAQPGIKDEIRRLVRGDAETRDHNGETVAIDLCEDVAKMTYQAYKLRAEGQNPEEWHALYFPESDGSTRLGFSRDISAIGYVG